MVNIYVAYVIEVVLSGAGIVLSSSTAIHSCPISIIPPMFGSHLYLQVARTKTKNGKTGKLKKLTLFHNSKISLTEKYVHYFGASCSIGP